MDKTVSSQVNFHEEQDKDGTTYFHKVLDRDKQYSMQDVIQEITTCIEDMSRVPGKNMHILVHVSKSIEEEK